jgi:hypothetical protein
MPSAGGRRRASVGLILISLCFFVDSANAELTPKQDKEWAAIAGAWWLNAKCGYLDEATKVEFEWTIAQLTTEISKKVGARRTFLRTEIAKKVAERRSCDEASREIVTWSVDAARRLNGELGGEKYSVGTSALQYDLQRLETVAVAVGVEERCRFGPQEGRTFFIALFESLLRPMSEAANDDKLPFRMDVARTMNRDGEKPSCTNDSHMVVLLAVGEAKSLGTKYRVWSPEKGLLQ